MATIWSIFIPYSFTGCILEKFTISYTYFICTESSLRIQNTNERRLYSQAIRNVPVFFSGYNLFYETGLSCGHQTRNSFFRGGGGGGRGRGLLACSQLHARHGSSPA